MKRLLVLLSWLLAAAVCAPAARAQPAEPGSSASSNAEASKKKADDSQAELNTSAAAAVATHSVPRVRPPDFLENLVDEILRAFNVRSSGNTATHWIIFALILAGALLLRRVVTDVIFNQLKRLAARTETTLDDKLFPALETPVATFVMLFGIFAALKVLKLSESADEALGYASTISFSLVVFWGLLRAFNTILDHAHLIAAQKGLAIAAFMPWLKKSLVVLFVIIGVLLIAQSLGADVKAFLAGLGIGGLAFALAAQDTIANVFGSIVVAIDQPFKVGEVVKIGAHTGTAEDIGLRSTKIRLVDRSLVIIPNKTVAAESVVNLSRFIQRRTEQTLGLTYETTPDQMEAILREIRELIRGEPEVDQASVVVAFTNLSASSLDVLVVYSTTSADALAAIKLKERLNLAFMRAVAAHGLSFAFPTQSVVLSRPAAKPAGDRSAGS
ncbi:MAG: MscS Mechanosensitive ion channel [Verrucomicrobia bacterium]|nr:MscS Mechanosensitive ion channel [Verrucomicrobiota bacterium]